MKYINKDDLVTIIQQRLMEESIALSASVSANIEDNTIVDDIESKSIDLAISYLAGKYNYNTIFSETNPIRNGVLVNIIACIVVYRCVRRNAARKVAEDYIQLYTDAIKQLEKIQSGAMKLVNCPLLTTTDGSLTSIKWGNSTNNDNFI